MTGHEWQLKVPTLLSTWGSYTLSTRGSYALSTLGSLTLHTWFFPSCPSSFKFRLTKLITSACHTVIELSLEHLSSRGCFGFLQQPSFSSIITKNCCVDAKFRLWLTVQVHSSADKTFVSI